jgi:hypothetical protein
MTWKRIVVNGQERILISKNGRFGGILTPGEYQMFIASGVYLELERHDLRHLVFQSV